MDTEEEKEFIAVMIQTIARSRGYADYFDCPLSRNVGERGIVDRFCEALERKNQLFFDRSGVKSRGQGNDPPDCEAEDYLGNRLGIEVTELVDPTAIKNFKTTGVYEWAEWDREKIIKAITERLNSKDNPERIKGGPYTTYVVIIHTDEPWLNANYVSDLLKGVRFRKRRLIDRAFLLLSFDPNPGVMGYPYIELELST